MKKASIILLIIYLILLIWLVLFKLSPNILLVLDSNQRSINLIPFASSSFVIGAENVIYNCLAFIPFGLLLSVNFKGVKFKHKLAIIFILSLTFEILQFILAIGTTDITDIITNALGGYIGLQLYALGSKYINSEKLDKIIIILATLLFILFVIIRSSLRVKIV